MSKKALLIGINYIGTISELRGCINDVENVKKFLMEKMGYLEENITLLTDNTPLKPLKRNILTEFYKLIISGAKTIFFHYSGHGVNIRDLNGDEKDGNDETLVPLDYQSQGVIVDDQIKWLLQAVPPDTKLFSLLDCCNSGTGMDLCYNVYERVGKLYLMEDRNQSKTKGDVVMISGCQDWQTSADSFEENSFQGALTYCFLNILNKSLDITYEKLYRDLRTMLREKRYSQIPNLSTGKMFILTQKVSF